jgi:hypothetical protein
VGGAEESIENIVSKYTPTHQPLKSLIESWEGIIWPYRNREIFKESMSKKREKSVMVVGKGTNLNFLNFRIPF